MTFFIRQAQLSDAAALAGLLIGRYDHPVAVCRDYDPRAPKVARLVCELIVSQLPTVSVEHVGSTAVEGCAGKGIIDRKKSLLCVRPLCCKLRLMLCWKRIEQKG